MKLSVCVPVGYDAILLKELLKKAAPQISGMADEMELIVLDYDERQRSRELVTEYHKTYDNIFYCAEPIADPKQRIWRMAQIARGEYIWVLNNLEIPTPGSLDFVYRILFHPMYAHNLRVIVLNYSKFECNVGLTLTSYEQLMDFQHVNESRYFEKGIELLNYFTLIDLRFMGSMILHRPGFLKTSFLEHPSDFQYPHLRTLIELLGMGAACYSPRLCTITRSGREEVPSVTTRYREIPELYFLAQDQGFSAKRTSVEVEKLGGQTLNYYFEALKERDWESTAPSVVGKYHSGHLYYWLYMIPGYYWYRGLNALTYFYRAWQDKRREAEKAEAEQVAPEAKEAAVAESVVNAMGNNLKQRVETVASEAANSPTPNTATQPNTPPHQVG